MSDTQKKPSYPRTIEGGKQSLLDRAIRVRKDNIARGRAFPPNTGERVCTLKSFLWQLVDSWELAPADIRPSKTWFEAMVKSVHETGEFDERKPQPHLQDPFAQSTPPPVRFPQVDTSLPIGPSLYDDIYRVGSLARPVHLASGDYGRTMKIIQDQLTAVYPDFRWEITSAIVRAALDKKPYDLTALLKGKAPTFIQGSNERAENYVENWLWPGRFLGARLNALAGETGVGKSTLCYLITAMVTIGGEWPLDEGRAPMGNVLLLTGEEDTTLPELAVQRFGGDLSKVTFLWPGELLLKGKAGQRKLREMIRKTSALLTVVDPFSAFSGLSNGASNDPDTIESILGPISRIAIEEKTAIIVVYPFNREKEVAGAGAFRSKARMVQALKFVGRDATKYRRPRVLGMNKTNRDFWQPDVNVFMKKLGTYEWHRQGKGISGRDTRDCRSEVARYLRDHEGKEIRASGLNAFLRDQGFTASPMRTAKRGLVWKKIQKDMILLDSANWRNDRVK